MARDPWMDDIYSKYNYFFTGRFIERRKRVDDLQLDWLDSERLYRSPKVVIYSREEILEKSNWSEDEVELLFADLRFPMTDLGKKQIIEAHALIQFFARKTLVREHQIEEEERRKYIFARLQR